MNAFNHEKLLSFARVGRILGEHLSTGPVHYETIRRWATTGLRGVRLDALWVGGRRYTTESSLQAFCEAIGVRRSQFCGEMQAAVDAERESSPPIRDRRAEEALRHIRALGPQGRSRYQYVQAGGIDRERKAREEQECSTADAIG